MKIRVLAFFVVQCRPAASIEIHPLLTVALSERQLAHAERNKVRAAYNRAQYLAERKKMMQAWADYLNSIKAGGNVVAIHEKRAI